ncbi:hypothetical protein ACFQL1_16005 [Halomicroarcula sp. GCM10025709]|uniref:hypothetical protein n=1 Tax=Haloarcula TaxID=2237 RepID=UPI0024C42851|nr:hypothetical protein [Halomicroarcula sp. YJ-61-S]
MIPEWGLRRDPWGNLQTIVNMGLQTAPTVDAVCEICGQRQAATLTSDSHPDGPNLLACEGCSL